MVAGLGRWWRQGCIGYGDRVGRLGRQGFPKAPCVFPIYCVLFLFTSI